MKFLVDPQLITDALKDITFASGFGSLSRLKALFAKKFGMSMRDYRNAAKNTTSKS